MTVDLQIIEAAVARYERERDRYIKLADRVADLCRSAVVEQNAIRAQVTSRTKTVRSFEGKLRRFASRRDKKFSTIDDIFAVIGDFAGVRIATYRPEDEPRVTELLKKRFCGPDGGPVDVDPKDKLNPAAGQFYRATHCQVHLPDNELIGNYGNLRGASCEVQVCSMMAHVWNEIEHDIGYKPEGDGPSDAELGLLETLGHLSRAGDAAITRLLAANVARMTAQTGDFSDIHEFVARTREFFPHADLSVNAGVAFAAVELLDLNSVERLRSELGDGALDYHVAKKMIESFNDYLIQEHEKDLILNPASADLVTISIIENKYKMLLTGDVDHNTPNITRIISLSKLYAEFMKNQRDVNTNMGSK